MLPGVIRVQASSSGASLLPLRVQFSHCLEHAGRQPAVRLLRVSLVDTTLCSRGSYGNPSIDQFSGGAYRARDLEDATRMHVYQAARAFPLVGDHVRYR